MSAPTIRDGDAPASAASDPGRGAFVQAKAGGLLPMWGIAVLVFVIVGIAAFTAYWSFAIATFEERVAGWIEQREAEGWRIDRGAVTRSGFPARLRLTLVDGSIAAPDGWAWMSPRTELSLPVFAGWGGRAVPVDVAFAGEQRLSLMPAGPIIRARGDRLVARVADDAGRLPTGTFTADNLAVAGEGGAPIVISRLEAASSGDPGRKANLDDASFDLAVHAHGVVMPPSLAPALGERIERLDVEARLMGSLGKPPWPEALRRWRDEGGTIEVSRLGLVYGPLRVSGDGTLALNPRGDIIAAFSITAQGLAATLSALAARGVIAPQVAAAAGVLLRSPTTPPDAADAGGKGGGTSLTVPLSIQERTVFLGPLPIARLPAPPWSPEGR